MRAQVTPFRASSFTTRNYDRATLTCLRPPTSRRRVKTTLTRTHQYERIDHTGCDAALRTINPYGLPSQESRSSICRKQITNTSRIFYVGAGCAFIRVIYSAGAFSLKMTGSRYELPKYRRDAMENLIIKTDVTVPIITIFHMTPNINRMNRRNQFRCSCN